MQYGHLFFWNICNLAHFVRCRVYRGEGVYAEVACCGGGKFNAEEGCTPNSRYCSDHRKFLFWDLLHGSPVQSPSSS